MHIQKLRFVLVTLLLHASLVSAVEFVQLEPSQPHAGEPVSMVIRYGVCDLLNGDAEISQLDNHIHAVIHGVRLIQPFCVIPIEEASYLLGSFDAGTWVLNIDYRYVYDGTDASFIEPVDTVTFDVLPTAIGSATPVPTLDRWGKGALALLAIAMAGCGFRRRMFAARA